MKMKIVNLTPHPLTLRTSAGEDYVVAPTVPPARVSVDPAPLEEVPGLPVPVAGPTRYGAIEHLPPPTEGTIFITSLLVAQQARRPDVLSPGTGPQDDPVRDEHGRIIAVTRLIRWA